MAEVKNSSFIALLKFVFATVITAASMGTFLWLHDFIWAAVAFLFLVIGLWSIFGAFSPDKSDGNELKVLRILHALGGRSSMAAFEARLEEVTDIFGVYSGEHLEDLHIAVERLAQDGRIRIEGEVISIASGT